MKNDLSFNEIDLIVYINSFKEMNEIFNEVKKIEKKLEKEGYKINIEIRYKRKIYIMEINDKQEKTVSEFIEETKNNLTFF